MVARQIVLAGNGPGATHLAAGAGKRGDLLVGQGEASDGVH